MNFMEYLDQIPTSKEEKKLKKAIKEKCDVSPVTMLKWVRGGMPDVKSKRIIAGLVGLSVDELWPVNSRIEDAVIVK